MTARSEFARRSLCRRRSRGAGLSGETAPRRQREDWHGEEGTPMAEAEWVEGCVETAVCSMISRR